MVGENHARRIADELGIKVNQVSAAAELLEDGCTVPFIARYRKEATGSLDEVHTQRSAIASNNSRNLKSAARPY